MSDEDKRDEKIGRAIVNITWIFFAIKFIVIVSLIALAVLFFMGKPLWIAPVIGLAAFILYKLVWGLIWKFIEWTSRL